MSKKTTAAAAVAFVAVAGFVGFGLWKASQPAPEVFQGQIEAQEADIAPKVTARIAQILVKEGDQIAVGAPLIRMDSPEVQAKLAQATAAQEAAQAVAAKGRAWRPPARGGNGPPELAARRGRRRPGRKLVQARGRPGPRGWWPRKSATRPRPTSGHRATRPWPPRRSTTWPAPAPAPRTSPPPAPRRGRWRAWSPRCKPPRPRRN